LDHRILKPFLFKIAEKQGGKIDLCTSGGGLPDRIDKRDRRQA
jgi:hypothetical protein